MLVCVLPIQLHRKPLTVAEFISPLSKINPIYQEEEQAYRVIKIHRVIKIYTQISRTEYRYHMPCVMVISPLTCYLFQCAYMS